MWHWVRGVQGRALVGAGGQGLVWHGVGADAFEELLRRLVVRVLAMVLAAREAVVDTFEEDTLVEAIARELERSHGFTYVDDEKLTASMSVGMDAAETYLVETSAEFRSVIAEVDLSS